MPKWGRVSDPEPRIISLLRMLRVRKDVSAEILNSAFAELDSILSEWIAHEDLSRLRVALGVIATRGRRRKQLTVDRQTDLVIRLVNAALKGSDVRTFRSAADVLVVEEKTIERAWKEWGDLQVSSLRACVGHPMLGPAVLAAIKLLPPTDNK